MSLDNSLFLAYEQQSCYKDQSKPGWLSSALKQFTSGQSPQTYCYDLSSKSEQSNQGAVVSHANQNENNAHVSHQYHAQESMFGIEISKQRLQYVLAALTSVATKLSEDTITYLNQGQAYEIKLENVSETKRGFMSSIINIGFHERHMQQAEGELWQQWRQQHPDEKIFTVDMKLSYNVFGVESDALNKYKFLWDSSKPAGVFIRINSISTEFTPKKHGGEKGVPFKLSLETSVYNSKTHESYFISAACCQIKVFKPKGAERKIRSDREKAAKRPLMEQEKYHRPCDQTIFKDCSLSSIHPLTDGSLCYFRPNNAASSANKSNTQNDGNASSASSGIGHSHHTPPSHHSDEDNEHANNTSIQNHSSDEDQIIAQNCNNHNIHSEQQQEQTSSNNQRQTQSSHGRSYQESPSQRNSSTPQHHNKSEMTDYSTNRLITHNISARSSVDNHADHNEHHHYSSNTNNNSNNNHSTSPGEIHFQTSSELLQLPHQPSAFNHQMYHSNQVRGVASLASINNSQHFGMAYYGHAIQATIPSHVTAPPNYSVPPTSGLPSIAHSSHNNHSCATQVQPTHTNSRVALDTYRQQFQQTKQASIGHQSSHCNSFKVSNLAQPGHNSNNFQYSSSHSDQCVDIGGSNDHKDGQTNNTTGGYLVDNYDPHQLNSSHSTSIAHNQQSLHRQRSASTSLATTTGSHCLTQSRHLTDNFPSSANSLFENQIATNHCFQATSSHNQLTSPNSASCNQKGGAQSWSQTHENLTGSLSHHNYNFANHHNTDSDNNSPIKSQNNSSPNSASSCYSIFKTMTPVSHRVQPEIGKISRHIKQITANSSCAEVVSWLTSNRFGTNIKTFSNFSGSDFLRLSKTELIEICGFIDGIRLYNNLHNQPIRPKTVIYVSYQGSDVFNPIYLYDVTLREILRQLSIVFGSIARRNSDVDNDSETKEGKTRIQKPNINSESSSDSRSSMEDLSPEVGPEDAYNQGEMFYDIDMNRANNKCGQGSPLRAHKRSNQNQHDNLIDRLVIEGITPVKIVATEQVIQMLENESVWALNFKTGSSGIVDACLTACASRRTNKQ